MNITFLGTGAAELNPDPFCHCDYCEKVRKMISEGTYKPRKRASTLLGKNTLVDIGPDVMAASMEYSAPFTEVDNIFITHTHEDHFCFSNINVLSMTHSPIGKPVSIYLSPEGFKWVNDMIDATSKLYNPISGMTHLIEQGLISFKSITPYESHTIGGMEIFAVQSNHMSYGQDEYALNYRFTFKDGKKLLYVVDSGLYSEKNLKALAGSDCDCLIMEGTRGFMETPENYSHLNAENFCKNVCDFLEYGIIKKDAAVYATHIATSPDIFCRNNDYQRYLDDNCGGKPVLAYDGLVAKL